MTFTYNTNIPAANNNPSTDQPKMQVNTNSIQNLIAVDHLGFNNSVLGNASSGGFHTVIHEVTQAADPATVTGFNQIYSKIYTPDVTGGGTPDTQLFTKTSLGGVSQLTGNKGATNGYVWTAGILFQWGVVINPGSSGTVVYKSAGGIPFPNNIFNVQLTFQRVTTSNAISFYIDNANPPTLTQFGYQSTSSGSNKLYWFAIGN